MKPSREKPNTSGKNESKNDSSFTLSRTKHEINKEEKTNPVDKKR